MTYCIFAIIIAIIIGIGLLYFLISTISSIEISLNIGLSIIKTNLSIINILNNFMDLLNMILTHTQFTYKFNNNILIDNIQNNSQIILSIRSDIIISII